MFLIGLDHRWAGIQNRLKTAGGIVFLLGILSLILAPFVGSLAFDNLWSVEPLTYSGAGGRWPRRRLDFLHREQRDEQKPWR